MRLRIRGAVTGIVLLVLASACSAAPATQQAGKVQGGPGLHPAATDEELVRRIASSDGPGAAGGTFLPSARPGRRAARAITETEAKVPENSLIVAPHGRPDGNGSLARPLDLASVLSKSSVPNGADILLRRGMYAGTFVSNLEGTPERPVIVRSFPGEWAVLDAGSTRRTTLEIRGDSSIFKDLEIAHSGRARDGILPERFITGTGVDVSGDNVKLLGLVVHDNETGIELSSRANGAQVNGGVIYNNGYVSTGRVRGGGIAAEIGSGKKHIENTFVFNNFGEGIDVSDFADETSAITLRGNTAFENGAPARGRVENLTISSGYPADQVRLEHNVFFHRGNIGANVELGRSLVSNGEAVLFANAIVGGEDVLSMRDWRKLDVSSNLIARSRGADPERPAIELRTPGLFDAPVPQAYRFAANRYLDVARDAKTFVLNADPDRPRSRALSFEGWRRRTGLDSSSTHTDRVDLAPIVYVQPDALAPGRVNVTVVNPSAASSVLVDLREAGLAKGTSFEIRDVQDPNGPPVVTGTYTGSRVSLRMRSDRVAQPVGGRGKVSHTPAEFGSFVLIATR